MHCSNDHPWWVSHLRLPIIIGTMAVLLFALTAPAHGETTDPAAVPPAPLAESSASAAEAAEAAAGDLSGEPAGTPDTDEPENTGDTASPSAAAPPPDAAVATQSTVHRVASQPQALERATRAPVNHTATQAIRRVSGEVESISQAVQETAVQTVAGKTPGGDLPPPHLHPHRRNPLRLTGEVIKRGFQGLIAPSRVRSMSLPGEALFISELGPIASPPTAGLPGAAAASPLLRERVEVLAGFPMERPFLLGGIEPLRLLIVQAGAAASVLPLPLGAPDGALRGSAGAPSGDPSTPLNRNLPTPPGSPDAVASGLGGSSFVPIVALLALLALAAPAIFRRPGEVPLFRAPTPFVCALERPG